MSLLVVLAYCIATGVVAGFFAGLLGIGGGMIIVPVLCHLLPQWGFSPEHTMLVAIGTSLATIVFTGMSSCRAHYKNDNVDTKLVMPLMIGVALATSATAMVAEHFSAEGMKQFFAISMALLAIKMAFLSNPSGHSNIGKGGLAVVGAVTGSISSLLGIGGGAILVPILSFFNVDMKKAIGSAAACTMIVAVFGTLGYILSGQDNTELPSYMLGYVYLPAFAGIVLSSVFMAPIGANLTQCLETKKIKKVFAIFLLCVASKMMFF